MAENARDNRNRSRREESPVVKPKARPGAEIVLSGNVAKNLTSSTQIFERSFPFDEFKQLTGLLFKQPMASKEQDKNCFILARYPDSDEVDFVIPCGPSVEPGDALDELEFGEILEGKESIWIAYRPSAAAGGSWQ